MPVDRLPRLIGVLHLLPLPGAPSPSPGLREVERRAVADAQALVRGGCRAAILENLGDAPFTRAAVGPEVIAAMTRVAGAVRRACPELVLGINVLRNDALAALAIASAVEASFIRVNVLSGSSWTDQGLIQSAARDLLLLRRRLEADGGPVIRIAADVCVKHGVPAGAADAVREARDASGRGGADFIIISGAGTGLATDLSNIEEIRRAAAVPVLVGSGVTLQTAGEVAARSDGAIVGTALHVDGDLSRPLCDDRVRSMVQVFVKDV